MATTTRERLADRLRDSPATASTLSRELGVPTTTVYDHVRHVARSVSGEERLLVAPPTCADCGFDDFDDLVNDPSRCPACRSENVEEAVFKID